jgi:phage terminase large subunit-like protein
VNLPSPALPQIAQMIKQAGDVDLEKFLGSLNPSELRALLDRWELWALPWQIMPSGDDWRIWMLRGGRGIGKTLVISQAVHQLAQDPKRLGGGIIGVIGRTHSDVRSVNVEAPGTGILATAPHGFKPEYSPGHGTLVYPNGVQVRLFSADSPQSLRGNNFAALLCDELQSWAKVEDIWWGELEPAVRKGGARIIIAMTPRNLKFFRDLEAMPGTAVSTATMFQNPYLPKDYRERMAARYAGNPLGRQELWGEYVEDVAGALVNFKLIDQHRTRKAPYQSLKRVVIAVDPAVTKTSTSDETGIMVVGLDTEGHGYVLEDASGKYGIADGEWAQLVAKLYHTYSADLVVAEVNNGGDFVEAGLRAVDPGIGYQSVRASRGKRTRAEPVGTLYHRGLIHHVGVLDALENELTTWVPGDPSPNRLDALVWAITELMLSNEPKKPSINWDAFA